MPVREERLRCPACPAGPSKARLVQKAIKRYTGGFHSDRTEPRPATRSIHAESETTTLEEANIQPPSARPFVSAFPGRMPELPRKEAASPSVPKVRLLQGPRSN